MPNVNEYLAAMRVPPEIPEWAEGMWCMHRLTLHNMIWRHSNTNRLIPSGTYTMLKRCTEATLHLQSFEWECVMEDTLIELRRHLPIALHASGRVLVTGLGLGCVVRGLLLNPRVEHIDVVEIDPTILARIGPSLEGNARVTLHLGDALTFSWPKGTRWNYAWHDVWCENGSLHVLHAELMMRYADIARRQGAWQFPRETKRRFPLPIVNQSARVLRTIRSA